MAVLELDDIGNHKIDTSNLVVSKCHIKRTSSILILVEDWELITEILYVRVIIKQSLDRSTVKCKVRDHILLAQFEEHLEKDLWIWLICDQ